jgi:hypothetical protein
LFIVDGAKALSRAVRDTFGNFALIQRCQVHKGRGDHSMPTLQNPRHERFAQELATGKTADAAYVPGWILSKPE